MTHSSDERGAEMRELFFETSQELLQSLNDEALKLEKTSRPMSNWCAASAASSTPSRGTPQLAAFGS